MIHRLAVSHNYRHPCPDTVLSCLKVRNTVVMNAYKLWLLCLNQVSITKNKYTSKCARTKTLVFRNLGLAVTINIDRETERQRDRETERQRDRDMAKGRQAGKRAESS